jgi:YcxB-like protein
MTIQFSFEKSKVLQGLRYHFITRPELRLMLILVNVFALTSAALFYFKVVTPLAFFIGSTLWFIMMISVWFLLPVIVYRRTATFKDHFTMSFEEDSFSLGNERGSRSWPWKALTVLQESPHFFHLYFDSRSFFLVPKSGCKTSDEVFELRQLLKKHIQKK